MNIEQHTSSSSTSGLPLAEINMIVDNVNNIKFENISMIQYFPNINETGKNILLIGEQHLSINNYKELLEFFETLIKKSNKVGECLDFFIEFHHFLKVPLDYTNRQEFLAHLRQELKKLLNNNETYPLLRVHNIDIRIYDPKEEEQFDSFIYLINIFVHLYLFYQIEFEYYNILYILLQDINIFFYFLGIGNEGQIRSGKIDYLNFFRNNHNRQNLFYGIFNFMTNNNFEEWEGKIEIELNQNQYDVLSETRIKKQMKKVSPHFFTEEQLTMFINEKFYEIKREYTKPIYFLLYIFALYTDIYTITRMFRNFTPGKQKKKHPCNDSSETSMNIIHYGGSVHTKNIQEFIQKYVLKNTFPKGYDYFDFDLKRDVF